jgi:hypothetical protein
VLPDLDDVVNDAVVEVFASKVRVAGSRENLEDAVVDGEKRDVESSSSEIVDDDVTLAAGLV